MTGLTQDLPGDHLYIRSVGAEGIRVGDDWHQGSLVISGDRLITDWPPQTTEQLQADLFETIYALAPEVVLIGTGSQQKFLHPQSLTGFYQRGIGVEVMTTDAACRTFNLLITDDRRVVAALLPMDKG